LYSNTQRLDSAGRLRMDDLEVEDSIQDEVNRRWKIVSTENLDQLADLDGYRSDFLRIFGFGLPGVDYDVEVDHLMVGDP
jgi:enoyl-[acyl-carrier protein] reductase/trans-2-enoyl-CoA reductase (NAD+)